MKRSAINAAPDIDRGEFAALDTLHTVCRETTSARIAWRIGRKFSIEAIREIFGEADTPRERRMSAARRQ